MSDEFLPTGKAWFTSNTAQKKAAVASSFNELYGNDKAYINASPSQQAAYQKAHQQVIEDSAYNHSANPYNIEMTSKQATADSSNALQNIFTKIIDSHRDALGRLAVIPDAMVPDGVLSEKFAERAAIHSEKVKSKIITAEERQVAATLLNAEKKIKAAGGFWTAGGFKAAAETIPDLITNPIGVIDLAADSSSSMTMMGLGAWGGGTAGSAVPVVGTAIGAAAGMFAAESGDAVTSKFYEIFNDKLQAKGLTQTQSNYAELAKDTEFVKQAQADSIKYAATLSATDTAVGFGLGKLVTAPARAALATARKAVLAGDQTAIQALSVAKNIPIAQVTESIINKEAAAILKARNFKSKLGVVGSHYTGQVASEPFSEAAATSAIGEENTFTNLMNETLGGIGTGPISMAVDKAAFGTKVAGNIVKNVGQGAVDLVQNMVSGTPESRAASSELQVVADTVKAQVQAPADVKFVADVDAANPEDAESYKHLHDPTNPETYNPLKAMAIVSKIIDPTSHTKALTIAMDYYKTALPFRQEYSALEETQKTRELTKPELQRATQLQGIIEDQATVFKQLHGAVTNIAAQLIPETEPNPITPTDDAPAILHKLGSRSTRGNTTEELKEVTAALSRPGIEEAKPALIATREALLARQKIEQDQITQSESDKKGVQDVSNDIYNGVYGSDFKGIDAYQAGIKYFLTPKSETDKTPRNETKALSELKGLRAFADRHTEKLAIITDLVNTFRNHKSNSDPFSPAQKQKIEELQAENPNFHVAEGLVTKIWPAIKKEVRALNNEVKLAEVTYSTMTGKPYTSTSTSTTSSSTKAPAASTGTNTTPATTPTPVTPVEPLVPIEPSAVPASNTTLQSAKTTLATIKDKNNKHHSQGDNLYEHMVTGLETTGKIPYEVNDVTYHADIPESAVKLATDIYNNNLAAFKKHKDDHSAIYNEAVHTGAVNDLYQSLIDVAEYKRTPKDDSVVQPKDGTVFKSGTFEWSKEAIGHPYGNIDICSVTSESVVSNLKRQGISASVASISQKDVSGHTDRNGTHKVAVAVVDGKTFIVDMPQNEMGKPLTKTRENQWSILTTTFAPRFIEATPENISKFYGGGSKNVEYSLKQINNKVSSLSPVATTAEEAVQNTIDSIKKEKNIDLSVSNTTKQDTTITPVVNSTQTNHADVVKQRVNDAVKILDSGGKVDFIAAGHTDIKDKKVKQGEFATQRQLTNLGYVRVVDKQTKIATYKQSAVQEAKQPVTPAPITTMSSKPLTGETRLKEIANEYRTGKITQEGRDELLSLYQKAISNKDSQEHIDKIRTFGQTYRRALDKLPAAIDPLVSPEVIDKPISKNEAKIIGNASKLKRVTVKYNIEGGPTQEIKGSEFTVEGLDPHTFIVTAEGKGKSKFRVREKSTGNALPNTFKTQKEAVAASVAWMQKLGKDVIDKSIAGHSVKLVSDPVSAPVEASNTKDIVTPALTNAEVPIDTQEATEPDTPPVDALEKYDIDMNTLLIHMPTEKDQNRMLTYEQAIAENAQQLKEAEAVRECVNGMG